MVLCYSGPNCLRQDVTWGAWFGENYLKTVQDKSLEQLKLIL